MPNGIITEQDLNKMSVEEIKSLRQQLMQQKQQMQGGTGLGVLRGALVGGLRGFAGKPPETAGGEYEELLRQEQLKNVIDPTRRMALMKEKAALSRQAGVTAPVTAPGITPETPITPAPEEEPPSQYVTVMKWDYDKDTDTEFQRPETEINPEYQRYLEMKEFKTKEEDKILNKIKEDKKQQEANFGKVSALMQNLVSRWKSAAQEKTEKGFAPGLPALARGGVGKAFRERGIPHTSAYPGQRIETAMAMSRIITGGARIIRSVINQLMTTLPEDDAIPENMRTKVAQTLTNAYRLSVGRRLTPDEEEKINAEVERILQTPPAEDIIVSKPQLQQNIPEEDIQFTMKKYGLSREEVLKRMGR